MKNKPYIIFIDVEVIVAVVLQYVIDSTCVLHNSKKEGKYSSVL